MLAERFRRGKLQKARDGHAVAAKAAYGYRYESRRGAVPARLVVDDAEAAMVRQLYAWIAEDGLTIRQCMRRLNEGPWITRSGRSLWSSSVVHHIVSDPIYTGTAYVNRFEYVAPSKPRTRSLQIRIRPGSEATWALSRLKARHLPNMLKEPWPPSVIECEIRIHVRG